MPEAHGTITLAVPGQVLAVMAVTVAAVCALCAHIPYKPPVHSKGRNRTIIFVGAGGGGEGADCFGKVAKCLPFTFRFLVLAFALLFPL